MRPIIDLLPIEELKNRQTAQMLERTDFIAAALFSQEFPQESQKRFQLAALGNYPSFRAGLAFGLNRSWKKRRTQTGESYWYSKTDNLSISLTSKRAFVTSSKNETAPFAEEPTAKPPEGFGEFSLGSPVSCWIENPAPVFSQILDNFGISLRFPVQQFFLNLYPVSTDQYEVLVRMQFENSTQARGMSAVFFLANSFSQDNPDSILSALLFANRPIVNGSNLDLRSSGLGEDEIALLLQMFFIYF